MKFESESQVYELVRSGEVAAKVASLNSRFVGKKVLMLVKENEAGVEFVATENMSSMKHFANFMDVSVGDEGACVFFQGEVQNPEDLPYDLEENEVALVLYDGYGMAGPFEDILDVTSHIEHFLFSMIGAYIEKFSVIIGRELSPKAKENLIRKICAKENFGDIIIG